MQKDDLIGQILNAWHVHDRINLTLCGGSSTT